MKLELGKRYRCLNGCIIHVYGIRTDGNAECHVDNGQDRPMLFDAETGRPVGGGLSPYEAIRLEGPELYFRLKCRYGHEETVSESKLTRHANRLYEEAQTIDSESEANAKFILAAAALRMIEQAKAPLPKPSPLKLKSNEPIRPQLSALLIEIGLDPARFLNNPEKDIKPMWVDPTQKPDAKRTAEYAAEELAKLMKDDLGVTIPPILLRLWLVERWDRVAKLAHKIHGS